MADVYRTGYVYVQKQFAGVLQETDSGYSFEYDKEYLYGEHPVAVSLTLPLKEDAYTSATFFPFFDGLIPEGWLLNVVSRNWKIDRNDRFGLLLSACRDCIGDVSIKSEAEL
jgi:serine/threonine-protein kinase HipA